MVPESTTSKQDWRTPLWVINGFRLLHLVIDVAADAFNHVLPRYLTDAFNHPWDSNFWCNPPYRKANEFLEHGILEVAKHGVIGVYLLRIPSIGSGWWIRCAPFCLTVVVAPRIHFVDPEHPDKVTSPHGSMFVIVSPKTVREAKPGVMPFATMEASTSRGIEQWLLTNKGLYL